MSARFESKARSAYGWSAMAKIRSDGLEPRGHNRRRSRLFGASVGRAGPVPGHGLPRCDWTRRPRRSPPGQTPEGCAARAPFALPARRCQRNVRKAERALDRPAGQTSVKPQARAGFRAGHPSASGNGPPCRRRSAGPMTKAHRRERPACRWPPASDGWTPRVRSGDLRPRICLKTVGAMTIFVSTQDG